MSQSRKPVAVVFVILAVIVAVVLSGGGPDPERVLTYPAEVRDLVITVQAEGVLEAKKAHTIVAPQLNWTMLKVAWLPPEGSWVEKGEVVVELEAGDIERAYLTARNEVEIAKADAEQEIAKMALEQAQLESQVKNTKASLRVSQLQLDRMAFEPARSQEIRRLQIRQEELELDKVEKKLASNKEIMKEESARLQLMVRQAESKLTQAKHHLSQLQLKAPVDGFVQYEKHWSGDKITAGTQLWPNMGIVKIPDLSVMQVNLQVGETDAQKLSNGQNAIIIVPSLQELQLTGRVSRVDRVAKPVRRNRKNTKVKRVEVIVEIDSSDTELVPGLSAECRIEVGKLENALVLPQECQFENDSLKFVYVLEENFFIPRPVSISKYGENFIAVVGDIERGQRCALSEPPPSLIRWPERLQLPEIPAKPDSAKPAQPADSVGRKELFSVKEETAFEIKSAKE